MILWTEKEGKTRNVHLEVRMSFGVSEAFAHLSQEDLYFRVGPLIQTFSQQIVSNEDAVDTI